MGILRIAMVAPFSAKPKGTVPVRMLPIAKTLKKNGNDVLIIVPPYDNLSESGKEYTLEDIRISNVGFRDWPVIKYPLTIFRLCLKISRFKPQCVYVFKPKGYSGLVAIFLILLKRIGIARNLIIVLDTDDWEGHGGFYDFYLERAVYPKLMLDFFDFQERWIPEYVDSITVASLALQKRLLENGVPETKVFYVPNCAPQKDFSVNRSEVRDLRRQLGLENSKVILLYTRFFEYDVKKVIDIFSRVRRNLENVKLLVLGKGDFGEERVLQDLALKAGFQDLLAYVGWIQPQEIPQYLALGDVAIYPFDDTPLNRAKCPGKLVELMLAGKAVVAENVGQIPEYIIHGKSGFLVVPNDVDEFASLTVKLLLNPDLRKKIGDNARIRLVTSFNWEKTTANLARMLKSSLTSKSS